MESKEIMKRDQGKLIKFTDEDKEKFLQLYRHTPNIGKIARKMGFNRRTVFRHLKQDDAFKMAFNDVVEEINDDLEEFMIEHAKTRGGFMDRIAYLKAHRQKFQDKVKHSHQVDHKVIDDLYERIPKDKVLNVKAV